MNRMIVTTLVLALALPARAQTLAQALEQAWARHAEAAAFTAREDEAGARIELAAGLTPGPPALSLATLNDRLDRNRGKQEWEAELAVPLWLPGQRTAQRTEAESRREALAARRALLRLQVAGALREAWWALAAARAAHALAGRRVETARLLEADVERRHRAGELARLDANQARGERLAAEAEAAEAETALRAAEQHWRQLTGAPPPSALAEEEVAPVREPAEDHPQLAAAAASVRAARSQLRLAEESRREAPQLAVRLVRGRGEVAEPYANTVGVKLTIPFSSGARMRQASAAAHAGALEAEAELAQVQQRVRLEVELARQALEAAERRLAMARERHELAVDNLRLAEKAFALGESDLAALLRLRATAFEAEAFLNRQQVARGAARSRLNQALGVLP